MKPITILCAALGGEGGGVLADWLRSAAMAANLPVQSTSIPGVAQRTGATTYYLEVFPQTWDTLGGKRPVFSLTPTPGNVDVMVCSELLEAGRGLQNGFVDGSTVLITSTHRIYATIEKMQPTDGRFDDSKIIDAARAIAKRAVLMDMNALATESGTVISAVMFGALAGSGALPFGRDVCEAAIKQGGKGIEASLRGFARAYALAHANASETTAIEAAEEAQPVGILGQSSSDSKLTWMPESARALALEGVKRLNDYQGSAYAADYVARLHAFKGRDERVVSAVARHLALWMSFEDLIRVADLKTRASRFAKLRDEVKAKPGEIVHAIEFLKPGFDEFVSLLPAGMGARVQAWGIKRGYSGRLNVGMHVKSASVTGFLMMRGLASLKFWRPRTLRYAEEHAMITRWLAAMRATAHDGLALEIAQCARLIKGYSDTHKRGRANFERIFTNLVESPRIADEDDRAKAVFAAREAALNDAEGKRLDQTLQGHGIAPRPIKPVPIEFVRNPARRASLEKR